MKTAHYIRRLTARQLAADQGSEPRLSLMHPQFNLREIAKQMVLLEDHLFHVHKQCPDCIRKHLLTIEAFAEEAVSLDNEVGLYVETSSLIAEMARYWVEQFNDERPPSEIGQEVRKVRKKLSEMVADPRDMTNRVAARHLNGISLCAHLGLREVPRSEPRST